MESCTETAPIPLEHVLRCSLEKINEAKKCRTGANLRKNLMIANIIYKTRNEILEYRTRAFIERNRAHPGIKGRNQVTCVQEKPLEEDVQDVEDTCVELEPRAEEVLEECVVQEEVALVEDCEEEEEEDEEIEVEVCLPVVEEKENIHPLPGDVLGPLVIDTESNQSTEVCDTPAKSPRKRRSMDEDSGPLERCPSPCKRASINQTPLPYDPLGPQCSAPAPAINSLSETFEKAISLLPPPTSDLPPPVTLLLPASSLPALASSGHSGVLVLDSSGLTSGGQPLLLQLSPVHFMQQQQQCPAAAS